MNTKSYIDSSLIAPCGMNCGICLAFLREKNKCSGCWFDNEQKPKHCIMCVIKNCDLLAKTSSKFCYECEKYPCTRLKQLDKRYRTRYHMSMLENLTNIRDSGLTNFLKSESKRWTCSSCGGTVCVHRGYCMECQRN